MGGRRRHPHAQLPVGRDGRTAGRVGQRAGLARHGAAGASGWARLPGRAVPASPGRCGSGRMGLWKVARSRRLDGIYLCLLGKWEVKGNGRGEEEELRRSVNREGKAQNQKGERHKELRNKA